MADPTIIDVNPTNPTPKRRWFRRESKKDPDLIEVRHAMDGVELPFRVVFKHPTWYRFLIAMLWLGGPAILGWIYFAGYLHGGNGCYTCYQNQPVDANAPAVTPDQAPPSQTTTKDLAKDLAELQSLIEKLAEPKPDIQPAPASTATASATVATTTVQTQPPPTPPTPSTVILKIPDPVPVRVVKQPQPKPEVPAKPPKLTDAEERNEALFKRLRCKYHRVCD